MEEKRRLEVYNLIILDESGSMNAIYEQALSGMNETINGIRCAQEDHPSQMQYLSVVTFEGRGMNGVKTRRDRVAINDVKDFTEKDYRPGGCTPLYDAMGSAVSHLEREIGEGAAVLVTVITDGLENSSEEYSGRDIKRMVKRLRKKGWTFVYIGTNQDAVEVARGLNIVNALNFRATPEGTRKMSMVHRNASKAYLDKIQMMYDSVEEEVIAPCVEVIDFFSKEDEQE